MIAGLTTLLVVLTLGLTVWSLAYVAIDRVIDMPLFVGGMVLTVAMVLQLLVGVVGLVRTDRPVSAPLFVGYLLVGGDGAARSARSGRPWSTAAGARRCWPPRA